MWSLSGNALEADRQVAEHPLLQCSLVPVLGERHKCQQHYEGEYEVVRRGEAALPYDEMVTPQRHDVGGVAVGRSLSRPLLAAQVLGGTAIEPAGANGEAVQEAD